MTGRFDKILRAAKPEGIPYNHREAFCLMWYACPCGHRERIWNSRDGVTPFGTLCPSCERPTLQHVEFGRDECVPHHKPAIGQRTWVSMTRERAEALARRRIASAVADPRCSADDRDRFSDPSMLKRLVESFYENGHAPALDISGYSERAQHLPADDTEGAAV